MATKLEAATRGQSMLTTDYLVVGAGMCGLYQLYRLLQDGRDVIAVDNNADIGGTWYKNRYPGCRFDSEVYSYHYSFSQEIIDEWNWSEKFASQSEAWAYLDHVANRFSLRDHIRFNSQVTDATWDDEQGRWIVTLEDGVQVSAKFVLWAIGLLSVPTTPKLPDLDKFAGTAVHTFDWDESIEYEGKRVAVMGTGATGVQLVGELAGKVEHLYVLQRSANWSMPLSNGPLTKADNDALRARAQEIFEACQASPSSFIHRPDRLKTTDVSDEERLARWEELYWAPGAGLYLGNYRDTIMEEGPNKLLSEFVAQKIRERVKDPEVAEKLIPKDHGFGTRRVGGESGFYEAFNRDNVTLVDLTEQPIESFTATAIVVKDGDGQAELPVDILAFATGFDAVTGAYERINIRGANGILLKDYWADGPRTNMGIQVAGYPNMFMLAGPQSASGSSNFGRGIEDIVNWVTGFINDIEANGWDRVESSPEAEQAWIDHVREVNSVLLVTKTKSWYTGFNRNIDRGDQPRLVMYFGGGPLYRKLLTKESTSGYPGFQKDSA